jgi:hypothetical protein
VGSSVLLGSSTRVTSEALIGCVAGFGFGLLWGVGLSVFLLVRFTVFLATVGRRLREKREQVGSEARRPA